LDCRQAVYASVGAYLRMRTLNILFVCSRNKWRSRTAEKIFKDHGHYNVKSAGTESSAQVRVTEQLLKWADKIFVMEEKHKSRMLMDFEDIANKKEIIVLGIEDEYKFMDPELIEILKISVQPYLEHE